MRCKLTSDTSTCGRTAAAPFISFTSRLERKRPAQFSQKLHFHRQRLITKPRRLASKVDINCALIGVDLQAPEAKLAGMVSTE